MPSSEIEHFSASPSSSCCLLSYTEGRGETLTRSCGRAGHPLLPSDGSPFAALRPAFGVWDRRWTVREKQRCGQQDTRGAGENEKAYDTTIVNKPTSLPDFLAILRRRAWIVALVVVVTPLSAVVLSTLQTPLYKATSKILVNRANIVSAITNVTDPSTLGNDPTRFLTTQSDIARSPTLASLVVKAAGVPGMTVEKFLASSSVDAASNADILNVSVSNTSRRYATRLADVYAQEFTTFKTDLDTARINDALKTLKLRIKALSAGGVSSASPSYATLLQYESQLETVGKLLANNTQVLNQAAAEKVRPRTKRNALLGGILGLALGIGLAFLAEALDRRVRVEKEIEESLGLPLLARIPRPPHRLRKTNQLVMLAEPTGHESEAFRKLRTHIEFVNIESHARTILVTSAVGQEGKSTTIANLAITFARSGRRVALVDFDLRRPFLDRFFRLDSVPGVTDVVLKHATLIEAMRPIALTPPVPDLNPSRSSKGAVDDRKGGFHSRGRSVSSSQASATQSAVPSQNGHSNIEGVLSVLPAGTAHLDAGEFVGNESIHWLIEELRQQFDYVLLDAPPLLAVGDAMTLSTGVDAIIAVTRLRIVQPPLLHELARQLEMCRAEKLGFVLTGAELEEGYGYPDHYYAYTRSTAERGEQHVP
jgi:polysaccharide biosynthesis transport protein